MVNVVVSLYYYLLVIKAAYLTEPKEDLPELHVPPPVKWLATSLVALMIVLGFYPWHLIELAQAAVRGLM
jgi:NADH-quinone oxidoreductase subunit N